jgi:Holliday junction resolvasome RuvABC endonuclease subunit
MGKSNNRSRQIIIGIDPSLTGLGLAVLVDGKFDSVKGWTETVKLAKQHKGVLCRCKLKKNDDTEKRWRICMLTDWVEEQIVRSVNGAPDVTFNVAIEGYAFSSNLRGTSGLHELGGAIRDRLWQLKIPYRVYDPSSLKLAFTGNGSADKGDMKVQCLKRFNIDFTEYGSAGENLADALLLAALLHTELEVKSGRLDLDRIEDNARKVLLRTTKSNPVAFISQDLISRINFNAPEIIC